MSAPPSPPFADQESEDTGVALEGSVARTIFVVIHANVN